MGGTEAPAAVAMDGAAIDLQAEIAACRSAHGDSYIRVSAFDNSTGWETIRLSFLVNRPKDEKGFHLARQEGRNRQISYTTTAR